LKITAFLLIHRQRTMPWKARATPRTRKWKYPCWRRAAQI